jgi:hypothetical protein
MDKLSAQTCSVRLNLRYSVLDENTQAPIIDAMSKRAMVKLTGFPKARAICVNYIPQYSDVRLWPRRSLA